MYTPNMKNNLEIQDCIIDSVSNVYLRFKKNMTQKLKKYNLTFEQSQILKLLFDNQAMSQSEICKKTSSDASNITMILKRMNENGYIEKSQHPKDKRTTIISASQKAFDLKDELDRISDHNLCCSLDNISKEEYQIALKVIREMNRQLLQEEFNKLI
ncbi:hypothetical protein CRU91_03325 [Aliarcobacter vitoriensis]|uniref:HTH marR-type domain-containing protein n=2 Tax=Aliarcobacter vitoriensis TaxID=2011099 RepID=A0A366MUU6_9BACT|nr:hypothetical protein CRU91_03325 [Aliarcobacter vitoriensis]